jgi:glycerophosphoryl diester phosphodiesterase
VMKYPLSIKKILSEKTGFPFLTIAHRGASYYAPENTLPAFELAVDMNADVIEIDVTLSSDRIPVIFHDKIMDKKSSGTGLVIHRDLKYIKSADAGSWFSKKFKGTEILTLEEFLGWIRGRIAVNIEIKKEVQILSPDMAAEEKIVNLVEKYGMGDHVFYSSFSYACVKKLKIIDKGIPVAVLYDPKQLKGVGPAELVKRLGADLFNCSWRELGSGWRHELQNQHIPVLVYTVNRPGRMKNLIQKGVNGIFSDRPDLLKKVATG